MGDYDDLASSSERAILSDKKLHDSSIKTLEELYKTHTDRFYNEIDFMKGRCIGLIEGNHYAEFQNGTTTTQRLCDMLECKYLGVSSFIRLRFSYTKNNSRSLDIFAYHGKGASRLVGSCLNTVQQMSERAEADIFLMGHNHRKSIGLGEKLILSGSENLKLRYRKQIYANTGSFLKGYEPNIKSYIVDAGLNPTSLGVIKIEITPRKKGDDALELDIHGSI